MKIRFTEHAIDRFMERRMPGASRKEALAEMERLAARAAPLKERTKEGDAQLLADGVLLVVKRDCGAGTAQDCCTVLFDNRAEATNPLAEEIERWGVAADEALPAPAHRRKRSRRASRW